MGGTADAHVLLGRYVRIQTDRGEMMTQRTDTVVIGGGQAGLVVGYHLQQRGIDHVILDDRERTGDAWRSRWDSLVLFTPARSISLDGMPFPAPGDHYPTKDETADYLESYAAHFELPVRNGVSVTQVRREDGRFLVETKSLTYEGDNVIVAMSNYQRPKVPPFASELDPSITQLHSVEYRNPHQVGEGGVLVVGAGNSGGEIALELSRTHRTWLAGTESGHIPFRLERPFGRHIGTRLVPLVGHRLVTLRNPLGRKIRPKFLKMAAPLVRVKPQDLVEAGVERVDRVIGTENGLPLVDGAKPLAVGTVIWCTGFERTTPWLDLPVFDADGSPRHDRGVAADIPGLFFVGQKFQFAPSSDTLVGVSRDARHVVSAVDARRGAAATMPS